MREWIDELSLWMEAQEKLESSNEMIEEASMVALETDALMELSDQLQSAYSQMREKVEHVSR